ncbi:hypothetical protein AB0L85_31115 [Streptomyces sp. NPDC052051]|uniref:hypothetical protein n=1 Tax=Streptomyces sp. NPDC052051 TaxID=3154649 RepID=UPI003430E4BD
MPHCIVRIFEPLLRLLLPAPGRHRSPDQPSADLGVDAPIACPSRASAPLVPRGPRRSPTISASLPSDGTAPTRRWPTRLEQKVAALRSHAVLGRTESPWLFPGSGPGPPISAWVIGERLRKLGIRLAEACSTALFQFATELPAAVLACTLGIDITVAVKWQRAAAGDWAAYAADVSQRRRS